MHALHVILVKFPPGTQGSPAELKRLAREIAMSETAGYCGRVFDYRSEDDAGGWSDEFPGEGVVLGAEEPDRFRVLLFRYKDRPLEAAREYLNDFRCEADGRAPKELGEELLARLWSGEISRLEGYCLVQALRLAAGEYSFDSQFYSVDDAGTCVSESVLREVLTSPERYALVMSDYHI